MDNDSDATALSAQIQISVALIGTARKLAIEPLVLAKRWGITPENAQKTIDAITQRGLSSLCGTSCILRHDVCQYSVQKGQQMCTSLCHRLWMDKSFPNGI